MTPNLFLILNEDCNLDCTYCNVAKSKKELGQKDILQSFIYFFKFFPEAKSYNIFFTGGEPLLSYKNMVFAINFLKKFEARLQKNIHIHFPTNATLLNEENLTYFQKNSITLSLSLDTLDGEYDKRNYTGGKGLSSVPVISKSMSLYLKFASILRIKMVVTPDRAKYIAEDFQRFYDIGFPFINIQPAHGLYWEEEAQKEYIRQIEHLKKTLHKFPHLQSTTLKRSNSETMKMKRCAKGDSEICIDGYGDVYVCDAFLAYPHPKRKEFSHDNIYNPSFNKEKFEQGKNWKYCNNDILAGTDGVTEKDLTKCTTCKETVSCSKLCNATPINNQPLDKKILLSNFHLFKALDDIL